MIYASIVSLPSFDNVKAEWFPEIEHHAPAVPIIFVGTKLDLREERGTMDQYDIVDRDLKPENILFDANGHIAVCAF